jgi:spore coat polysaccharide biosynthesis predicted glycosyltransferase SpsG
VILTLAFDEGPGVGLGHRRRVEALTTALHALGVAAECRPLAPALERGEAITGEVVLVDSYRLRADDTARVHARAVVAIDDIERDLAVELVIDPDPGADARVHRAARHVLAGAPYAIVAPSLGAAEPAPVRDTAERLLVATGATDADGVGARLASEIAGAMPAAEVRLVVGPWGRASSDARVAEIRAPAGLAEELHAADVVLTAGGVTMLEACCLARPTVAIAIAPNQRRAVAGAAQAGAVVAADVASAADVTVRLAHDRDARARLAASARALIDGQGATRTAAVVASMARHVLHVR